MVMASRSPIRGTTPNLVLIGVPDQAALERVREKLRCSEIAYVSWEEPDYDYGFTAIATEPVMEEEKGIFAHYRLWKPVFRGSSETRAAGPSLDRKTVVQFHPPEPSSHSSSGQSSTL